MFKKNELVVYPSQGVSKVIRIETKSDNQKYYVLNCLLSNMVIIVPEKQIEQLGIRKIVSKEIAQEIISVLKTNSIDIKLDDSTWNRRYRNYMEMIKSGDIHKIAEVTLHLSILQDNKDLSFGERKMLSACKELLSAELAIALSQSVAETELELSGILKRA